MVSSSSPPELLLQHEVLAYLKLKRTQSTNQFFSASQGGHFESKTKCNRIVFVSDDVYSKAGEYPSMANTEFTKHRRLDYSTIAQTPLSCSADEDGRGGLAAMTDSSVKFGGGEIWRLDA